MFDLGGESRSGRVWRSAVGGFLLALLLGNPLAARERRTIQKSATNPQLRAMQTFLDQINPTTVNAGLGVLKVQSHLNNNQRAIVLFDLSSLPNVGVKIAQLRLHVLTAPEAGRRYQAFAVTSFFNQSDASWNIRASDLAWGAPGGDFGATPTGTINVGTGSTNVTWNITADVQSWYNGTPNYGTLIKDSVEDATGDPDNDNDTNDSFGTVFSSNADPNPANRPLLTVTYVQNVSNLTATAGNGSVGLSWTNPVPVSGATVLPSEPYAGVLILRRANLPVDKGSVPADGANPGLCATVGSGVVVFNNLANATTFTDNAADTCGAPLNGTTYYYKVFARDSRNNYSTNGTAAAGGSTFTEEISAMPDATAPMSSNWIAATHSTTLAPPSLFPGAVVMLGSQSNLLFAIDATTGLRAYPPVSLGGAISGRSPILDAADSSVGQNVIYVADQSGLAYAVATDTGQILWAVDPFRNGGTPFLAAGGLMVKSFASTAFTLPHDLFVVGTRNAGTTTGNAIAGIDGNTGATLWQTIGGTGTVPPMDIINSSPQVDYGRNLLWFTSRSNGGTAQPSLWGVDANTGAVRVTAALGDTDSSPVLPDGQEVLFEENGTSNGTLFAIDPATGNKLASLAYADGALVDYPIVVNFSTPYTVIFSGATAVHAVSYDVTAKTFTALWTRAINTPSAPVGVALSGLSDVYVGSNDGTIHEIDIASGADIRQVTANKGQPGFVGDPSMDLSLMRIYVSTTDQRMYAFPFPF